MFLSVFVPGFWFSDCRLIFYHLPFTAHNIPPVFSKVIFLPARILPLVRVHSQLHSGEDVLNVLKYPHLFFRRYDSQVEAGVTKGNSKKVVM